MRNLTRNDNPDPLWTIREVAEYVRVSVSTVKRWRRELGFPCERIAGTARYRRSKVDAWIEAQTDEAA